MCEVEYVNIRALERAQRIVEWQRSLLGAPRLDALIRLVAMHAVRNEHYFWAHPYNQELMNVFFSIQDEFPKPDLSILDDLHFRLLLHTVCHTPVRLCHQRPTMVRAVMNEFKRRTFSDDRPRQAAMWVHGIQVALHLRLRPSSHENQVDVLASRIPENKKLWDVDVCVRLLGTVSRKSYLSSVDFALLSQALSFLAITGHKVSSLQWDRIRQCCVRVLLAALDWEVPSTSTSEDAKNSNQHAGNLWMLVDCVLQVLHHVPTMVFAGRQQNGNWRKAFQQRMHAQASDEAEQRRVEDTTIFWFSFTSLLYRDVEHVRLLYTAYRRRLPAPVISFAERILQNRLTKLLQDRSQWTFVELAVAFPEVVLQRDENHAVAQFVVWLRSVEGTNGSIVPAARCIGALLASVWQQ
jgi:hypothetical protein